MQTNLKTYLFYFMSIILLIYIYYYYIRLYFKRFTVSRTSESDQRKSLSFPAELEHTNIECKYTIFLWFYFIGTFILFMHLNWRSFNGFTPTLPVSSLRLTNTYLQHKKFLFDKTKFVLLRFSLYYKNKINYYRIWKCKTFQGRILSHNGG